jgi:hypothetical protein
MHPYVAAQSNHDSLGSRRACACLAVGFSSKNDDRVLGV